MIEDGDSKLKKERVRSIAGAQTEGFWCLWGEGNREGANGFTRLTSLGQAKGSADLDSKAVKKRFGEGAFIKA